MLTFQKILSENIPMECIFASIIGYTGQISQDEYDALDKDEKKKYSLSDIVGKAGIEQSMDNVLQGTKGEKTVVCR